MASGWARTEPGAVLVFVRLTPKSVRDAIEGPERTDDGREHLKVRVRAVPEDGKANRALEKLIAKVAGIAKSDVAVVAGQTSRLKTVRIVYDNQEAVLDRLGGSARLAGRGSRPWPVRLPR